MQFFLRHVLGYVTFISCVQHVCDSNSQNIIFFYKKKKKRSCGHVEKDCRNTALEALSSKCSAAASISSETLRHGAFFLVC